MRLEKLEKKLEKIIDERIAFVNGKLVRLNNVEIVKFLNDNKFLFRVSVGFTYLVLCKLNKDMLEVLQIVDEEFEEDANYVVNGENVIKIIWTSFGDIETYDVRAYEYRFEDNKILLGEIRYTDLVKKPNMADVGEVGLTLINAIDNLYFPWSNLKICFMSLCIKWGEEIDWELYEKVITYLEEETEIDLDNYL